MSFWAHAMGKANSTVDKESGKIFLRSGGFLDGKKRGTELVISGETIQLNEVTRKGITTERFEISEISEIDLHLGGTGISGMFFFSGNRPKLWSRGTSFQAPDIFVAYEAYAYILSKRLNDPANPIKHKISPVVVGMKDQLDRGELDVEPLKAKGMYIPDTAPPVASAPATPTPQPTAGGSVADELLKLKQLVDMGVLTQDEFERKKTELLARM